MIPPADPRITLLTRVGCHLCEEARQLVAQVAEGTGQRWAELDVDADPDLRAEYGDLVPVALVDGRELGHFRLDAARLVAALTAPTS